MVIGVNYFPLKLKTSWHPTLTTGCERQRVMDLSRPRQREKVSTSTWILLAPAKSFLSQSSRPVRPPASTGCFYGSISTTR